MSTAYDVRVDAVDARGLDLGFNSSKITALSHVSAYRRRTPFPDDSRDSYFVCAVGTRIGQLQTVLIHPAPPRGLHAPLSHPHRARAMVDGIDSGQCAVLWAGMAAGAWAEAGGAVDRVIFVPQARRLVVLVGGQVHVHSLSSDFQGTYVGFLFDPATLAAESERVPLDGVSDVAVRTSKDNAVVIAALDAIQSRVIVVSFDGSSPWHIQNFTVEAPTSVAWVGDFIGVVNGAEYLFYSAESSTPIDRVSFGASQGSLAMCPLFDATVYSDHHRHRHSPSEVAVIAVDPTWFFAFQVVVLRASEGRVEENRKFVTLASTPPKAIMSWGPWLLLQLEGSVQIYNHTSGQLMQAFSAEAPPRLLSLAGRASLYTPAADPLFRNVYTLPSYELLLSASGQAFTICFYAPIDIASELLANNRNGNIQAAHDKAEGLMRYGHAVHSAQLIRPLADNGDISTASFGSLMGLPTSAAPESFILQNDRYTALLEEFCNVGVAPIKGPGMCGVCGTKVRSFFSKAIHCSACGTQCCDQCCPSRQLRGLGWLEDEGDTRVCAACFPRCQRNLQLLLEYHLFADAIAYIEEHEDLAPPFQLASGGEAVLLRCAEVGQYALCATLLPRVLRSDEQLWQEWFQRFTMWNASAYLARWVPWASLQGQVTPWLFTSILTKLVATDPTSLTLLLKKWPLDLYDPAVIIAAVETRLTALQSEARLFQESCQQGCKVFRGERGSMATAVGQLYRDRHVEIYVRAIIDLYERLGDHGGKVRVYLQHWLQFRPGYPPLGRPRAPSLLEGAADSLAADGPPPAYASDYASDSGAFSHLPGADLKRQHADNATAVVPALAYSDLMIEHDLVHLILKPEHRPTSPYTGPSLLHTVVSDLRDDFPAFFLRVPDLNTRSDVVKSVIDQLVAVADKQRKEWGEMIEEGISPPIEVDYSLLLIHSLDALSRYNNDPSNLKLTAAYHELQADLYIKYMPDRLLEFLQNDSVTVDLPRVTEFVRERRMYRELAHIVRRTGDYAEALRLIVRCQKSVVAGLDFLRSVGAGPDLWQQFIKHVIQSPVLIGELIDNIEGNIDAAEFLRAIPDVHRIALPREKERLHSMLANANVTSSLHERTVQSICEDNLRAHTHHLRQRRSAVRFETKGTCPLCQEAILRESECSVAACGHMFHTRCLKTQFGAERIPQRQFQLYHRKKQRTWDFYFSSLELYRESDINDIVELLPPQSFARIVSFLEWREQLAAMSVCRAWHVAMHEALYGKSLEDTPLSDWQHYTLSHGDCTGTSQKAPALRRLGLPRSRINTTVAFGERSFSTSDIKCIVCAK